MTCSKLDAPKYGKVWVTGNSYSSTAYYTCNHGYDLDGVYSRKCQHDGRWGGKAPECRPSKRGKHDCHSSIHKFLANNIIIYTPQLPAPSLLRRSMAVSPCQATPILQQHTTAVITDMTWMAHTRENASMMELGTERLQNAVQQREVSSENTTHLSIVYKLMLTKHLCRRLS